MAFNLADTYFVSRLGTEQLAALSFGFPVIMVLISVGIGLGAGTSSVVARAIGGESEESIRRLATDSMILTTVFAVVLAILGILTIDHAGPSRIDAIVDLVARDGVERLPQADHETLMGVVLPRYRLHAFDVSAAARLSLIARHCLAIQSGETGDGR